MKKIILAMFASIMIIGFMVPKVLASNNNQADFKYLNSPLLIKVFNLSGNKIKAEVYNWNNAKDVPNNPKIISPGMDSSYAYPAIGYTEPSFPWNLSFKAQVLLRFKDSNNNILGYANITKGTKGRFSPKAYWDASKIDKNNTNIGVKVLHNETSDNSLLNETIYMTTIFIYVGKNIAISEKSCPQVDVSGDGDYSIYIRNLTNNSYTLHPLFKNDSGIQLKFWPSKLIRPNSATEIDLTYCKKNPQTNFIVLGLFNNKTNLPIDYITINYGPSIYGSAFYNVTAFDSGKTPVKLFGINGGNIEIDPTAGAKSI